MLGTTNPGCIRLHCCHSYPFIGNSAIHFLYFYNRNILCYMLGYPDNLLKMTYVICHSIDKRPINDSVNLPSIRPSDGDDIDHISNI